MDGVQQVGLSSHIEEIVKEKDKEKEYWGFDGRTVGYGAHLSIGRSDGMVLVLTRRLSKANSQLPIT